MSTSAPRKMDGGFPSIAAFESGDFDVETFDHESHIYVAWKMLESYPVLETIERFTGALRRLTTDLGIPGKYHETISWFYVLLIDERRQKAVNSGWESFKADNIDLFAKGLAVMNQYYSTERLWSAEAKQRFLLPGRQLEVDNPQCFK